MVGVVAGVVAAAGAGPVLVVVLGAVEVVVLGVVDVVVLGVVDVVEVVVGAVVVEVEVVVGDVGVVLAVMVLVVLVVVPGLVLPPPGLCVELPVGLLVVGAFAELECTCPYWTGRPRAGPMICGATMLAGPGTNSPRATAAAPPAKPRPLTA